MDVVVRAAAVFCFILFVTRIVGRRELSSMEPFDLILLVVIGDLVQQSVTQSDYSVTGAILAVSTFAVLSVAASYLNFRFPRIRPLLEGEPVIVLQDGEPVARNLRRNRVTVEELAEAAREQGIGSLSDVGWAVLENSGKITIIPKSS